MNLTYVFSHGDSVLISTFLLLIGMSALSWYIIFWKGWNLFQQKHSLAPVRELLQKSPQAFRETPLKNTRGYAGELLTQWRKALAAIEHEKAEQQGEFLALHLTQTLDHIRTQSDKGLTILASIGSSAPFIGLFGTVWGIYGALTDIAAAGNASLNVVAGPMGEALVATAVGLFAAIPAVLAYNSYVRANRLLIQDYRHIAERLALYSRLSPRGDASDKTMRLVAGE